MNAFSTPLEIDELACRLASSHVLVVGDVMLDRYWFGDCHRISPEAPVPVAKIERVDNRAGGAANVARNIVSLGANATLMAILGSDEAATELNGLMQQDNITCQWIEDSHSKTTVKLRVVARNQQLIRLDFESQPQQKSLDRLLHAFRQQLEHEACDVVVLSDYGKGSLSIAAEFIHLAREAGKPVLVDPKGSDYLRYRGATMLTPNLAELREVVGAWPDESSLQQKAQHLRRNLQLRALLLTRSEDGLSLFSEHSIDNLPTRAREVYDVSGAGDTVIAAMAAALAAGLSDQEAMEIANASAGIVVAKVGTAVCTFEELISALALCD